MSATNVNYIGTNSLTRLWSRISLLFVRKADLATTLEDYATKQYVIDSSYVHPTDGANVELNNSTGKFLGRIVVDECGHVTAVSQRSVTVEDIPTLSDKVDHDDIFDDNTGMIRPDLVGYTFSNLVPVMVHNASDTPEGVTWMDGSTQITGTLVANQNVLGILYFVPDGYGYYDEYTCLREGTSGSYTYSWGKISTSEMSTSGLSWVYTNT